MWESLYPYVATIVPSLALAVLFYFVMKALFNADKREREAEAEADAAAYARKLQNEQADQEE